VVDKQSPLFEEAFQQLEKTLQTLEAGGLTLDQATALFEEGTRLAQICNKRLDAAELKITELQNAFSQQSRHMNDEQESTL